MVQEMVSGTKIMSGFIGIIININLLSLNIYRDTKPLPNCV